MLLDKGEDINKSCNDGNIALKYAIEAGNEEIAQLLIERNSDLECDFHSSEISLLAFSANKSKPIHFMIRNRLIEELHRFFTQYSTKELRKEVEKSIDDDSMFKFTESHVEVFEMVQSYDPQDKTTQLEELIRKGVLDYFTTFEFQEKLVEDVINNYKEQKEMLEIAKVKLKHAFPEIGRAHV